MGAFTVTNGSGRTDAGVHASHQVANFRTTSRIPCSNLVTALNDLIAPTVRVKKAWEVRDTFHARYDVRAKTYWYRILQTPICSPFLVRFVYHHPQPLDRVEMSKAAELLEGKHDFTSFAAVGDHEVADRDARLLWPVVNSDAQPMDAQHPGPKESARMQGAPQAPQDQRPLPSIS